MKFSDFLNRDIYLSESQVQYLEEKLLVINNGKREGQIVFLTGGAASGKGFARENFLDNSIFKVRDVDDWKATFVKISKLRNKHKEIQNLDFKNPNDVFAMHKFIVKLGVKDKTLLNMLKDASQKRLPNIMFDITGKSLSDITKITPILKAFGYDSKNIHLIWILSNYSIAVKSNADRERVVPDDILLKTHEGASNTVYDIITKNTLPRSILDGQISVILNNRKNTIKFKEGATRKGNGSGEDIKTKTRAKGDVLRDKDGKSVFTGKKGKESTFVINSFTSMTLKKPGKPVTTRKELLSQLLDWIKENAPRTKATKNFFNK